MPKQLPLPPDLPKLVQSLSYPGVSRFDFVTTADGGWGVRAFVEHSSPQLTQELQGKVGAYPLFIATEEPPMQVARPAYPDQGE